METIKARVKDFLASVIHNEIDDDENIFDQGAINSLFAMQLVIFLEEEFNVQIDTDDLDFGNFKTVNTIVDLVERKTVMKAG